MSVFFALLLGSALTSKQIKAFLFVVMPSTSRNMLNVKPEADFPAGIKVWRCADVTPPRRLKILADLGKVIPIL